MTDYSESIINTREFLRRAEQCLQAKNTTGAYHHAMNAFKETEALLEYCLEGMKNDTNEQAQPTADVC
jgi:hypothetical protein